MSAHSGSKGILSSLLSQDFFYVFEVCLYMFFFLFYISVPVCYTLGVVVKVFFGVCVRRNTTLI